MKDISWPIALSYPLDDVSTEYGEAKLSVQDDKNVAYCVSALVCAW